MRTPVTKTDYEHLAAFRYGLRVFLRFSEEAAKAVGLTPQQHQALLSIVGFPEREQITIGELAERLQIRPHSAVGLVDRLENQGLVERHPGQDDRRQVYIQLTDEGKDVLDRLVVAHQAELRRIEPYWRRLFEAL